VIDKTQQKKKSRGPGRGDNRNYRRGPKRKGLGEAKDLRPSAMLLLIATEQDEAYDSIPIRDRLYVINRNQRCPMGK
jgi:hypothetical protein